MSETTDLAKEIVERIDIYAEKLGVMGSSIYEIIVQQQMVDAWTAIIGSTIAVLILTAILIFGLICRKYIPEDLGRYEENFWQVMSNVCLIMGGVILVFFSFVF